MYYAGTHKIATNHPAHRPQQAIYFSTFISHAPQFLVDVSDVIEIRRAAMRAFESQFYREGSTEPATMLAQKSFLDMIEARAREYGAMINVDFAEGFRSARPPRIDDIVKAFEGNEPGF